MILAPITPGSTMSDIISHPELQQGTTFSHTPADAVYRPLSGLALAAVIVSSLYALVMIVGVLIFIGYVLWGTP